MNELTPEPGRPNRVPAILPIIALLAEHPSSTADLETSEDPTTTGFQRYKTAAASTDLGPFPTTNSGIVSEWPLVVTGHKYDRPVPDRGILRGTSDSEDLGPNVWVWANQRVKVPESLAEALRDLQDVAQEAREEGFPQPTETVLSNAARLVRAIFGLHPFRLEVYPTPDGEVAIDALGDHSGSVILLCDAAGGALCLVNTGNGSHRARYSEVDQLPDWFLSEALAELARRNQETG